MSETEKAYAAGLFDGEGTVCITYRRPYRRSRNYSPQHSLVVSLGMTDLQVIAWLYCTFHGGSISRAKPRRSKINQRMCRQIYRWHLECEDALLFLETVRPYLRVKARQADIAIAHQKKKQDRRRKGQPGKRTPDNILADREQDMRDISALNHGQEIVH